MTQTHTHYEILNLPFPTSTSTTLTKQQLKTAYHRALLQHHPDKTSTSTTSSAPSTPTTTTKYTDTSSDNSKKHTIDAITTAYKTLSDPRQRAEYDARLRLERRNNAQTSGPDAHFHTGLEVVDLEDLHYEETETETVWYRGCRCGDERGFLVTEEDLEREVEGGEVVVGCRGCSLYLRVLFAVGD